MIYKKDVKNKNEARVALVVLNYNGRNFLKGCVDSLLAQSYGNFNIFIIDNYSIDNSVDFIKKQYPRKLYPKIRIIENSKNFGIGRGFNWVIKKLIKKFDYIGLFNSDIKLDRNWLKECVTTFSNFQDADVCASFILDWKGRRVDTAGGTIMNLLAGIFSGFLGGLPVEKIPSQHKNQEFPVFFGILTAMMVRASAFKKFGFFDEDYFMYFEDVDFSWRVLLRGRKIYCNPRAIVYHYGHGSKPTKKISLKLLKQTELNLLTTYFKNLSSLAFILIIIPLLIIRILLSFLYLPISPKITLAKINGIYLFLIRLLSGKYSEKKKFISRIRKLTDREVLAFSPTPLFSFTPLFSTIGRWFNLIDKVYNKKKAKR